MIAIVTVLLALPLGYRLRTVFAARVVYVLVYLWAFTFQGVYLLLDSVAGTTGQDPAFTPGGFPAAYGLVALLVLGVGLALVEAGHRLAARRRVRSEPVVV